MDMDEEMRDLSGTGYCLMLRYMYWCDKPNMYIGTGIGAMPSLDDSIDYLGRSSSSQHNQMSSPFIERNPLAFADHVMSLLESRQQLEFKELLPKGSTRKTAGIAFHHILSEFILCNP